jgi:tripartite-type tricarboxylate transporter receptor subunit TctC
MHADDRRLHRRLVRRDATSRLTRRALDAFAAALLPAAARAQGEAWPTRPIRMIVPFAPGGSSDVLARLIQPGLGAALGQPIVVENRPGAGSLLGTEAVARSAPDGYTVLLADLPFAIVPALQDRVPYDPIADFAPVSLVGVAPLLMFGHPSVPARNAAEFAALARVRPDHLTFGSGGVGAASHMMGELYQRLAGVRLVHVPYRGGGPAIQDLAAGNLHAAFFTIATAVAQLQSGQVRGLGVMSAERLHGQPDIPTFREQGIDLLAEHWWGVLAPARTPQPIVARMAAAIAGVVGQPDLAPRLDALGVLPRADGPDEFAARIRADLARWGEVARAGNIRAQ